MPDIAQILRQKTVEVNDTFNNEPYSMVVCVYPSPQTPHFAHLARRVQGETGDDAADAFAEMLSILIPKWDLEMDGEPFPPTKENFLRKVPREFSDHVFERAWKAVEAAQPKSTFIEDEKKEEAKAAK